MPEAKPRLSEDWLAVWGGLLIFALSLGVMAGVDLLGWGVKTQVWLQLANCLGAGIENLCRAAWRPVAAGNLLLSAVGNRPRSDGSCDCRIGWVPGRVHGDLLDQLCVLDCGQLRVYRGDAGQAEELRHPLVLEPHLGSRVHYRFARRVWSWGTSSRRFAEAIGTAIRPEWYIKTAIVILGGVLGIAAVEQWGLAKAVMFRGLCAIVEAYLIYWALVYFVARKFFKFSREWAAPLGLRASPFAASRRPLRPVRRSGRGRSCRSWCRRLW